MSLGFNAFQSLQNINVINGKPSVWGDALIVIKLKKVLMGMEMIGQSLT